MVSIYIFFLPCLYLYFLKVNIRNFTIHKLVRQCLYTGGECAVQILTENIRNNTICPQELISYDSRFLLLVKKKLLFD